MESESQLEILLESYRSIVSAKDHLAKIIQRIDHAKVELSILDQVVENEYKDVLAFEKLSLRSIFNKTLGNKKEQYEREKEEYLQAILKYQECTNMINLLKYEQTVIQEKIKNEKAIHAQLDQLIEKHKSEIIQKHPAKGEVIFSIENSLNVSLDLRKKFNSAYISAKEAKRLVAKMISHLNDSKHNGNWGSEIANQAKLKQAKNDNMDKAQALSFKVKQILQKLNDDLDHINLPDAINKENLEPFKTFNDVYYSALISDWIVHSKIIKSISYLEAILENSETILKEIKFKNQYYSKRVEELIQQRNKLLLDL